LDEIGFSLCLLMDFAISGADPYDSTTRMAYTGK